MAQSTNRTGIAIRETSDLSLGGISSQPIPIVTPSSQPVGRNVTGITPEVAPSDVAEALQKGSTPEIRIPAVTILGPSATASGGTRMARAVENVGFRRTNGINVLDTNVASNVRLLNPNFVNERRPNEESLHVGRQKFTNQQFVPINPYGISVQRPEILVVSDFYSIFSEESLNFSDHGLLLDIQFQARKLREETIEKLLSEVKKVDRNNQLKVLEKEFANALAKVDSASSFYKNTIEAIENIKSGFDIKSISPNSFNLKSFKTLKDFYELFMLFPEEAFNSFSNTKILMQLISDIRSISENYSFNLLDVGDVDRGVVGRASKNPVSIDKTYNPKKGFEFSYDTIRSYNSPVNAADTIFYQQFNSSLPANLEDRIKVLITILSKELRVSRGLGRARVQKLLREKFGATTTDGSPFDNVFGGIGSSIFEPVLGTASIANLLAIEDTTNLGQIIFPFEKKWIDINNQKAAYIPGASYFVESILDSVSQQGGFNLKPLTDYISQFITRVDDATDILANIFDFTDEVSTLSPKSLLKALLGKIQRSFQEMNNGYYASADNVVSAIFRLANTDNVLKQMMFQYFILLILKAQTQTKILASSIIQELEESIEALSFVTIRSEEISPNLKDPGAITSYQDRLATIIQERVIQLVQQAATITKFNNVQPGSGRAQNTNKKIVAFDADNITSISHALSRGSYLTRGFTEFFNNLEVLLGNEVNNFLTTNKKTRYNSLSVSTLALISFEIFSSLVIKYTDTDFQASEYITFPDMSVDIEFNNRMENSIRSIIEEPELPLPVIEDIVSTNGNFTNTSILNNGSRFNERNSVNSSRNLQNQATQGLRDSGLQKNLIDGTMQNEALLAGRYSTAGGGFTQISDLVLRQISTSTAGFSILEAQAVDRSLNIISQKIFEEDFSVACGVHILQTIKKKLKNSLDLAQAYFSPSTLNNFISLNLTAPEDIVKNLAPAQVRLLAKQKDFLLNSLREKESLTVLPTSSLDLNTKSVLFSLLSQGKYREVMNANNKMKILTLGVPSGFIKNLVERINVKNISTNSFQRKQNTDVVILNVYKRSLEFPELVFKPMKFYFDLSLFVENYDINPSPLETFQNILERMTLLDFENSTNPIKVTRQDIITSDAYSFLGVASIKEQIFENHIVSDLLQKYLQFLSGLNVQETVFLDKKSATFQSLSSQSSLNPRLEELIRNYIIQRREREIERDRSLRPIPNISLNEMLVSEVVDQSTKDLIKLLKVGSLSFQPNSILTALVSPKLFDRVLTVPLDTDGFEIDFQKTTSTESGREFFLKDIIQSKLDKTLPDGVYRFLPRKINETTFEDYFATLELVEG